MKSYQEIRSNRRWERQCLVWEIERLTEGRSKHLARLFELGQKLFVCARCGNISEFPHALVNGLKICDVCWWGSDVRYVLSYPSPPENLALTAIIASDLRRGKDFWRSEYRRGLSRTDVLSLANLMATKEYFHYLCDDDKWPRPLSNQSVERNAEIRKVKASLRYKAEHCGSIGSVVFQHVPAPASTEQP